MRWSIVVAVIGVMGLINTLVLNITERRRELGILRSIGAGGGALVRLLVSEGIVLGVVGYALGLGGGYLLARYLVALAGQQLFRMEFTLAPALLVFTGALTLSSRRARACRRVCSPRGCARSRRCAMSRRALVVLAVVLLLIGGGVVGWTPFLPAGAARCTRPSSSGARN